jgi:hypothetical protein
MNIKGNEHILKIRKLHSVHFPFLTKYEREILFLWSQWMLLKWDFKIHFRFLIRLGQKEMKQLEDKL